MSDSAISNARAWLADIQEGLAALDALNNGAESVTYDGEAFGDADALREQLEERPLSVQIRDGWRSPGAKGEPDEYEILLTTGGPALRIWGDLDDYCEPDDSPRLQWQDWGTPWTALQLEGAERKAVTAFARLFYFGEG